MKLFLYTDGASRGNPGESGIGIIIKDSKGNSIDSLGAYIGRTTNNVAEYLALLAGLQLAQKQQCQQLVVHSDSELMVRQLQGKYKVRNERLKRFFQEVQNVLKVVPFEIIFRHVPREENADADALANRGIDTKQQVPKSIVLPPIEEECLRKTG